MLRGRSIVLKTLSRVHADILPNPLSEETAKPDLAPKLLAKLILVRTVSSRSEYPATPLIAEHLYSASQRPADGGETQSIYE